MSTVRYVLRGGPVDGEFVDAPPAWLEAAASAAAKELSGVEHEAVLQGLIADGWMYEFSPDEAGVLIGRPATEVELALDRATRELLS